MTPLSIAKRARHALVFDVDNSQFMPGGSPCSLCGDRQAPSRSLSFIRVREKLGDHTEHVAFLCPDCIARAIIQVERCGLWRQLSASVATAVKRVLARKKAVTTTRGRS